MSIWKTAAYRSDSSRPNRIRGRRLAERYAIGSVIAGRVRNLTDFGAFIEVEEGIDGLVHVSDISPRRIKHPSEVLKKGERVEAVILNIDTDNHRLSLGIKQLQPDIWEQFFTTHRPARSVRGRVVRHAPFGVFVELDEGIEGLCHVSELDDDRSQQSSKTVSGLVKRLNSRSSN